MQIANPIYDVVFRYLMEDNEIAKIIISTIIGEQISKLVFQPTEHPIKEGVLLTVTRMDFTATINTPNGKKQVLIELQRAKYYLEVMRFRNYLGKQYRNKTNSIERITPRGKIRIEGMPLLPIYILGEKLTKDKIPVLRVKRQYVDVATNKTCYFQHPFIEGLTHEAIFIQVPHLPANKRTKLERLLNIFNQKNMGDNKHTLNIDESEFPQEFRKIIRRLKQAKADKKVVEAMEKEDDFLNMLLHVEKERDLAAQIAGENAQKVAQETKRADENAYKAAAATKRAEEESLKAEVNAKRAEENAKKAEENAKRAEEQTLIALQEKERLKKTALNFYQMGLPIADVATATGFSLEEVQQIIAENDAIA